MVTGDPLAAALHDRLGDRVETSVPIARLTTLRVGGPAKAVVTAQTDADLVAVADVAATHDAPIMAIGRGSNLLVPDHGWPGVVVLLGRGFREVVVAGVVVTAGAAQPLPALAQRVADAGLGGFAWATAVPGSVGGAVRMNAGAHGAEMSQCIVEAEVFRLSTRAREVWPVAALGLAYRHSELPDDAIVVAVRLALQPDSPDGIREAIADIRQWRRDHQPLNEPNCGSVFTNPPGDSAGRLVDLVGAKGLAIGGAMVSPRHANFIVTRPGVSAADVVGLIRKVHAMVLAGTGVDLVPEVRVAGLATTWWR